MFSVFLILLIFMVVVVLPGVVLHTFWEVLLDRMGLLRASLVVLSVVLLVVHPSWPVLLGEVVFWAGWMLLPRGLAPRPER